MRWHLGTVLRQSLEHVPAERVAIVDFHTGRKTTWGDLRRRVANLCAHLQALGIQRGDRVAFYSRNCPEYVEGLLAVLQIGAVHVNVNFRYTTGELRHVFANSDSRAVFLGAEFADRLADITEQLPELVACILIGEAPVPAGMQGIRHDIATASMPNPPQYSEDPDDRFLMYTGGTTGLPKGTIWTQEKLFRMFGVNYFARSGPRYPADNDDLLSMLRNNECYTEAVVAPMMHGLGVYSVLCTLSFGGTVVTSSAPRFSAPGLLRAVADHGVNVFKIPGDAMGKPLLEALDADPMTGQLDTLRMIISSAAVFSAHIKRRLVERVPHLLINDILGGSESAALGNAISSAASHAGSATDAALRLQAADCVKVFTPELKEVVPGSGERGMVARSGLIAEGYFKDPVKTAATFPVIDGERYCLLGDWAEVLADGSIKFLGRGNVCINTGGEKVFPEEVEQVLKALDGVDDCGVVGVDDARWGSAVTALLSLKAGQVFDLQATCLQLRECLADYKVPRHFVLVDDVNRGPNGKLDYQRLSARAAAALASNPDCLKVFSR